MKLVIILSFAALVVCDYSAPDQGVPSNAFGISEKVETTGGNIEPGKPLFNFKNFHSGIFSPAHFPPTSLSSTFPSFNYPYKAFNYATFSQGILPPISQIVPPISQVIPPIFGNAKPIFPAPSPIVPPAFSSQVLPPLSKSNLNKFTFPYYSPLYQFPYIFPSTFTFPSTIFPTQPQKQPAKNQPESLSNSYGPPASTPVEPESGTPAESSVPFEPSPVSFPYESAVAETQEPAVHQKPAQEYGLPPSK